VKSPDVQNLRIWLSCDVVREYHRLQAPNAAVTARTTLHHLMGRIQKPRTMLEEEEQPKAPTRTFLVGRCGVASTVSCTVGVAEPLLHLRGVRNIGWRAHEKSTQWIVPQSLKCSITLNPKPAEEQNLQLGRVQAAHLALTTACHETSRVAIKFMHIHTINKLRNLKIQDCNCLGVHLSKSAYIIFPPTTTTSCCSRCGLLLIVSPP
jgi:hypothetical protein